MTFYVTCLVQSALVGICAYGAIRIVQYEIEDYRWWQRERAALDRLCEKGCR